jgi:DNA-binding response OmpR family regulator
MRVIVAEDDQALSLFLRKGLELEGHTVQCIADGATALETILDDAPDLLVLDLGLPMLDGVDVLRALKDRVPAMSILVLTGRAHLPQKIECLNLGADDYLLKPFSLHELLARCRAIARRRLGAHTGLLQYEGLKMDRITRTVTYNGASVDFTTKEFTLLEHLLQNKGRAVSRRELLEEVWRMPPDAGTNVVDVYVNYLRRKLLGVGGGNLIETMRGEGYAIGTKKASEKGPTGGSRNPVVHAEAGSSPAAPIAPVAPVSPVPAPTPRHGHGRTFPQSVGAA